MEKTQNQKYAESLEKSIRNHHSQLKKTLEDFQEMCRIVDPERHFSQEIVVDIREAYKAIQEKVKEIKSIELLLQSKYRQYYHGILSGTGNWVRSLSSQRMLIPNSNTPCSR